MKLQTGSVVGKYKIEGVLGKGGMATVYKAVQQPLGRSVALKVLHSHLTIDKIVRERFLLEAKSIAKLKHQGIVQIYDYEASDDVSFISMEYIDGGALDQQLEARGGGDEGFKPLPIKQVLKIGMEIAEALDYAHQHGIIHRDVKPANILIGTDGRYVLTDFGIATLLHQNRMTADGATSGTPTYIPPEMITGDRGDERSDIYSLGIVMFQLLTGELPFNAENLYGVLMQHLNQPVPSIAERNPLVDDEVSEIVFKALAKKAEDRYQSGGEMADAIIDVLESETFSPRSSEEEELVVNPVYERGSSSQKDETLRDIVQRPAWIRPTLAAVGVIILFVGALFAFRQFRGGGAEEEIPGAQFTPFVDSFEDNAAVWPTGGAPKWIQLVDGMYEMRIEGANQVVSSVPFNGESYELFSYTAELIQTDGTPETGSGIVFYYKDSLNYHVFGVNGLGQWSIWELRDGNWQALESESGSAWIASTTVNLLNETNALRVETRPDDMDLFVNGEFLARVPFADAAERSGMIGFYLATSPDGAATPSVVKFDNVVVTP